MHAVLIAGAGPAGLMLAGELALAGVDVAIVERRENQELAGSRAGGLHARTLEVLDQRGIVDRFLSQGQVTKAALFAGISLDLGDLSGRHNYVLALWQNQIERILAGWVSELAVPIYRGREVTGFAQDETGVDLQLSDGQLRASYLVGCDGGRSLIRKAAGIDFPGLDATVSNLIAEAQFAHEPEWGMHRDALGLHSLSKLPDGRARILVTEREVRSGEPGPSELSDALIAAYGTDYGVHGATWISRFTDATRQAAAYRKGRVFLAGDAAHVHPPDGGQGIQTGIQDAVNLGWKLARVVYGKSPDSLLDTYHSERHPVGARVLQAVMTATALRRADERTKALRETMTELLGLAGPRRQFAARVAGLDIRYGPEGGHPLVGRRLPDLDLLTANGPRRVFSLLRDARPLLLSFNRPVNSVHRDVRSIETSYSGAWELPAIGAVPAPAAVLIRPDGYVAWAGDPGEPGLAGALTTWFG